MAEESSEQEDGGGEAEMRQQWATDNLARRAEMRKSKQKDNSGGISDAAKKAEQLAQRMAKLQKAWRVFNATTGLISIADLGLTLFLTWGAMNGQLIFGNAFKVRYVPPLALWEILILAVVDVLVAIILMFIVGFIAILADCGGIIDVIKCSAKLVA